MPIIFFTEVLSSKFPAWKFGFIFFASTAKKYYLSKKKPRNLIHSKFFEFFCSHSTTNECQGHSSLTAYSNSVWNFPFSVFIKDFPDTVHETHAHLTTPPPLQRHTTYKDQRSAEDVVPDTRNASRLPTHSWQTYIRNFAARTGPWSLFC